MFNFFKKKSQNIKHAESVKVSDPRLQALRQQLDAATPDQRKQIGGKEMLAYLTHAMQKSDPQGIRAEDMLCILGSLYGHSCLKAVMVESMNQQGNPLAGLMAVQMNDGSSMYVGEATLKKIFQSDDSLWSVIGKVAEQTGHREALETFNVEELIQHSAESMGSSEFGLVRVEQQHQPRLKPQQWLDELWKPYSEHLGGIISDQSEWPGCFGVSIYEAMLLAKDQLDIKTSIAIMVESALTTAKINSNK